MKTHQAIGFVTQYGKICKSIYGLGKTVDTESHENLQKEIEKWQNIVKVILDVILFCAKNYLAIQGTAEKEVIREPGSRVFLST